MAHTSQPPPLNTMTKAIVIDAIVYASGIRACIVARRLVAAGRKVLRSGLFVDSHDKIIGY